MHTVLRNVPSHLYICRECRTAAGSAGCEHICWPSLLGLWVESRCCSRLGWCEGGWTGGGLQQERQGEGDGSQNHSLMTPGPSPRCAGGPPETYESLINKLLICTKRLQRALGQTEADENGGGGRNGYRLETEQDAAGSIRELLSACIMCEDLIGFCLLVFRCINYLRRLSDIKGFSAPARSEKSADGEKVCCCSGGWCVALQTCAGCSHTRSHVSGDGPVRHTAVFARTLKCKNNNVENVLNSASV